MARSKKTRTMRGKLGKTGSKEMLKQQRKALKSKEERRFHSKKTKLRKEQAQKKMSRLGLLPAEAETKPAPRARRFTFVPPVVEQVEDIKDDRLDLDTDSAELSVNELMFAFTESD